MLVFRKRVLRISGSLPASAEIPCKDKLREIDMIRAIAILAVVVIHVTSFGTVETPQGSLTQKVYITLNVASHFCVPTFIYVSGLVLAYCYFARWNGRETVLFYRKRILRTVIPYLLATAFYWCWNAWLDGKAITWPSFQTFGQLLLHGTASYHLYFLILIVQYYLIFPLLMTLCRKWPVFIDVLFPLGVAVQIGYYFWCMWYVPNAYTSESGLTYLSHFMLGFWVGLRYHDLARRAGLFALILMPLCSLGVVGYIALQLHRAFVGTDLFPPAFYIFTVNAYAMLASLTLTALGRQLVYYAPRMLKLLMALGTASYGVYLLHPALLSLYRHSWGIPQSLEAYNVNSLGSFFFCLGSAWLLVAVYGVMNRKMQLRAEGSVPELKRNREL